jgi:hypothetical protein
MFITQLKTSQKKLVAKELLTAALTLGQPTLVQPNAENIVARTPTSEIQIFRPSHRETRWNGCTNNENSIVIDEYLKIQLDNIKAALVREGRRIPKRIEDAEGENYIRKCGNVTLVRSRDQVIKSFDLAFARWGEGGIAFEQNEFTGKVEAIIIPDKSGFWTCKVQTAITSLETLDRMYSVNPKQLRNGILGLLKQCNSEINQVPRIR